MVDLIYGLTEGGGILVSRFINDSDCDRPVQTCLPEA